MKTYIRWGSERGTVLIQVAIAIMALTAFTAFVLDYGVLWVSRNQAQNAADAGALAGAIARTYDETTNPPASGGKAEQSARWAARCASGSASCPAAPSSANPVWPSQAGASSGVEVLWDCPPTFAGRCVHRERVSRRYQWEHDASHVLRPAAGHHVAGDPGNGQRPRSQRERHPVLASVFNRR